MNLIRFEHLIYNGNIKKDYFFFLIKNKHLLLALLFLIFPHKLESKTSINILFKQQYQHKIKNVDLNQFQILTNLPVFLVTLFFDQKYIYKKNTLTEFDTVYDLKFSKELRHAKHKYIKNKPVNKSFLTKYFLSKVIDLCLILLLSLFIEYIILYSSSNPLNELLLDSYYDDYRIYLLTLFPILVFMLISYFLTNKVWLSFLLTLIPFASLAYANFFKLKYRDYPVVFSDILLMSEAKIMAGKYSIMPTLWHLKMLGLSLLFIYILRKKTFYGFYKKSINIIISCCLIFGLCFGIKRYMLTNGIYDYAGTNDVLNNQWIESQQLQRRGLLFSFIHSFNVAFPKEPENYDESYAKSILDKYQTFNIEENQKVNIISIMLESFNDFSTFDLNFTQDIYKPLHDLQNEGYYGHLVTNVFGGGTVNTERSFITGMYDHPQFNKPTNSYVQYLKSQGYNTVALHPCYGSFYNRRNVNDQLGYDNFYYFENRYHEIAGDDTFFKDIIQEFETQTATGKPYFNYSLTYQGHGPYPTDKENIPNYIEEPNIDPTLLKSINTYLHGIKNTNDNLQMLKDYLQNSNEPTVLVLFGDHNPVFGQGTIGFEKLGINMDLNSIEGFENYYSTPYVIWANNACHQQIPHLENKQGPDISPHYLMNEVFNYLGWKGNNFMQYTNDLKEIMPVYHTLYKKINNSYTMDINEEYNKIIDDFKQVQFYYGYNFSNGGTNNE